MDYKDFLKCSYDKATKLSDGGDCAPELASCTIDNIDIIAKNSENNKGIVAVLTTLMCYKVIHPAQDIRYHQQQLENGFSGRTVDTQYITPFLKSVDFPSMSESGWLTRSLEQAHPYTLDYPGKITPKIVKNAFLNIIHDVQVNNIDPEQVIVYFFYLLIKQRESLQTNLPKPHNLSIAKIVEILEKHFTYNYTCRGASRLPVLAIYAAYKCMVNQVDRYRHKILLPLELHTSADLRSGRIGDIEICNEDKSAFEGVEIKHLIQITPQLVKNAYEKFKIHGTDRYYLLTTANMDAADWDGINESIDEIRNIHGCQVIVNGVYSTLKYYLRLINDPAEFIGYYVDLLKEDVNIKYQHKQAWNDIISKLRGE